MSVGKQLQVSPVRLLDYTDLEVTFSPIGNPIENPECVLQFQNLTDTIVFFSINGIDDNFPLPAMSFFILDVGANKEVNEGLFLQAGTQFYVRYAYAAATTGFIAITTYTAVS